MITKTAITATPIISNSLLLNDFGGVVDCAGAFGKEALPSVGLPHAGQNLVSSLISFPHP
jgi:hypothetical protein